MNPHSFAFLVELVSVYVLVNDCALIFRLCGFRYQSVRWLEHDGIVEYHFLVGSIVGLFHDSVCHFLLRSR